MDQPISKPDKPWKCQCDGIRSFWSRVQRYMGNRVSSVGDTRTIFVGVGSQDIPEEQQTTFVDNRIKTCKYTLWNFVPKNLFEQFRRIANFYFLIMSIISVSIESPVSPLTSILPLAFVILVTAVKQAYEDWLRYRTDKEVNCYPVTVIRNGCLQELKAQQVRVGDVVKVVSDTEIPCDLVLLATSDTSGKCYITTANLDGETNLKTLFCPRMLRFVAVNNELSQLRACVECEQPTSDLYHFFGKILLLPSTDSSAGDDNHHLDASANNHGNNRHSPRTSLNNARNSSMKSQGRRHKQHQRSVSFVMNQRGDEIHQRNEPRTSIMSNYSERGVDTNEDDVNLRGTLERNSERGANFRRNLSRRASMRSDVRRTVKPSFIRQEEVDPEPADNLKRASVKGESAPLGTENLLLRGHRLKNTEYVYGCAVYTGQETKLALNSKMTSIKFSSVEKSINRFLLFFLALLIIEVALSTALKYIMEATTDDSVFWYIGGIKVKTIGVVAQDVFSFVILYNYIIPISLYVTIEMQKFLGTLFFEWDLEMYDATMDEAAICNTSDLNEELGQIQYLFTDKTGTLTENTMWFRRASVSGVSYLEVDGKLYTVPPSGDEKHKKLVETYPPDLEQFLLAMAICHSVQVNSSNAANNNSNSVDMDPSDDLDYQASSPDEKALVEASARLGVTFLGEKDDVIYVRHHGKVRQFVTRNCLEFTSDRKRMSVIVSDEDNVVWLYCKGAESHVVPLVTAGGVDETLAAVSEFAVRGLRAMVIGFRRLDESEYSVLSQAVDTARQNLTNRREEIIAASYDSLESSLTLLGATGVEDQLQDGVQETLESLRAAGIKVWILTGDKVETAVNISFSCGHFKHGMTLLYLRDHKTQDDCKQGIINLRKRVYEEKLENYGLIVDGTSLAFALKEPELFLELCQSSTAVICCRMSPLQKCEVVQLMKNSPEKPITAAIGDGANDVSMIQEAHVGLGLMGKEGRQAVRCADFAFAKFRFLRRTLLVHGNWYYLRIATLVQYFFYKNIVFITPQLFFAFYNAYSTQPLYDSWFLTLFNVTFSSLPILIYGLFEQNHSAQALLDFPQLYQKQSGDALMTWLCFFKWNALGVWHAVIVFFLPYAMMHTNDAMLLDSTPIDYWGYGTIVFHVVVCVTNLKLLIYSRYWTAVYLVCVFGSIALFITFAAVYSAIFIPSSSNMYNVYIQLLSSPTFWLLTIMLVVLCLIPDVIVSVLEPFQDAMKRRAKRLYRRTRRNSLISNGSWLSKRSGTLNITENSHL